MWEGRAQGLQQALHQARLEEVQLQQHHSNALDEAAGKDEDIGYQHALLETWEGATD